MESKIAATERLRREGRWDEASQHRDEIRRQLRADGKSKIEAGEAAWQAMIQEFPPKLAESKDASADQDDTELHDLDIDELISRADGSSLDLERDILWVYENVENKRVCAIDAPSLGAWSMLTWAREAPNRFFEQLLPKAMAIQEKQAATDIHDPGPDPVVDRIDNMLAKMQLDWERQAVADAAETVNRDVKSKMSDWERRFYLELPPEARESWRLQMVRLADELLKAHQKAELA